MQSQESEISAQGCMTDGPDNDSRSPFIEYFKNDDSKNGEEEDDWDAIEDIFTQHDRSLSLSQIRGDYSASDEEHESDDGNTKPAAKRLFEENKDGDDPKPCSKASLSKKNADNHAADGCLDCMDEVFASTDFDEELLCMDLSPNKQLAADSDSKSSGGVNNVPIIKKDLEVESKPLQMDFVTESKRQQQTLFQTVTKKKRARKSTGSSSGQTMTLTQHFSSMKKLKSDSSDEPPKSARLENGLVEIRLGAKMTTFKEGDIWLPHEKRYKDRGFAFTLGEIGTDGMVHDAEIATAWMKIEHSFLGSEEGARVKEYTGSEWVRVIKHEALPESGRIQLRKLSSRLTKNIPNQHTSLCYEMEGKNAHSFYYQYKNPPRIYHKIERPCALDTFAGAAGMSLGLEDEGIYVKYKVELNKNAADTLQMNFPGSHIFCEDITKFLESCRTQRVMIYPQRGDIAYIHGSPPCQGFSAVNTSGGANDQQNNECTIKFLEVVEYLQPSFVSMENVPGMGHEKNIRYLLRIIGGLLSISYQVRTCHVKASDFGDPQTRARVIVLASKRGHKLPILRPTHGEGRLKVVSAGEVLCNLEDIDPTSGVGLVELLTNGKRKAVWDHFKEGTDLSEKSDNDYVLNANLPANTVRKGNQMRHYKHDRYITVRERARLQSFPDNHRFAGSRKDMFNQIGNAVPVNLAKAIGRAVMESYQLGHHES